MIENLREKERETEINEREKKKAELKDGRKIENKINFYARQVRLREHCS